MSHWLDPVRLGLDRAVGPVTCFLRDDDAGWRDDRLYRLLDITWRHQVPIELAAIPAAVGPGLARHLRHAIGDRGSLVAVHQHGLAHINHEPAGRKAEFGPSRSAAQQRDDIATGRRSLQDSLGVALPPIFTPPWNRCTSVTIDALVELGFDLLCRDKTAAVHATGDLAELAVQLDWTGRRGVRHGAEHWGAAIASSVAGVEGPVGLMLHHAAMESDDLSLLSELLELWTTHEKVRLRPMAHCADALISRASRR